MQIKKLNKLEKIKETLFGFVIVYIKATDCKQASSIELFGQLVVYLMSFWFYFCLNVFNKKSKITKKV